MNARAALFGVFILFTLLVATALLWPRSGQAPNGAGSAYISGGFFTDPRTNITFGVPHGWSIAPIETVRLPKTIEQPYFALRNEGGSCTVLHARTPATSLAIPPLKQVSFGERVFNAEAEQFDSSWWVYADEAPERLEFQDGTRTPLPGEMRITQHSRNIDAEEGYWRPFILYSESGEPVNDQCDDDFSSMLATMRLFYQEISLDAESTGALYIRGGHREPLRVIFQGTDGVAREVMQLQSFDSFGDPAVYGNRLIMVREGRMFSIDPFSKRVSDISSVASLDGSSVIAFQITDGRVFYLTTPDSACLGVGRCRAELFSGELDGPPAQRVAEEVQASAILGYDQGENAVYLRSGYGDAGCFDAAISKFSLSAGILEHIDEFGGCEGDEGFEDALARSRAYEERFADERAIVDHVLVNGGRLLHPRESTIPDGAAYPLRFMR